MLRRPIAYYLVFREYQRRIITACKQKLLNPPEDTNNSCAYPQPALQGGGRDRCPLRHG
jgi:hypothetical protein